MSSFGRVCGLLAVLATGSWAHAESSSTWTELPKADASPPSPAAPSQLRITTRPSRKEPPGFTVIPVVAESPQPGTRQAVFPAASAASPSATPSAAAESEGLGNEADEAIRAEQERAKAYQGLNAFNPMSADALSAKDLLKMPPGAFPPQLQKIVSSSAFQSALKLASQPELTDAMLELSTSPKRLHLVFYELGWVLITFLLSVWRNARAESVGAKVWVKLSGTALFWVGMLLIPAFVLGGPYQQLWKALWKWVT